MVTYQSSGVDIDGANNFVRSIQSMMRSSCSPAVIRTRGGFGGLFDFPREKYHDPVLVSSTDGVGTKLLIAQTVGKHDTIGIDCVAMNVNDILCVGARPLFFLDYIACGKLHQEVLKNVVAGIVKGCRQSGCGLIGGETAEMPGMYGPEEYDLAGFAVGVVEKKKCIDGSNIRPGDQMIGLASSGLHSNGFSLVRKVFSPVEQKRLAGELLKPTRIYVREVLACLEKFSLKGIAHITGGAYYEKLTKILPPGTCFIVDRKSWPVPEIFDRVQDQGRVPREDMYKTFNMGIGMVLVVRPQDAVPVRNFLARRRLKTYVIGEVAKDAKRKLRFLN
ncbi:MAG TPA: phosphoribosylformylglycinamidine cyclo-ligase [Candidatus Omnitrophota bacterium]|nr:phosphoribosylformylglycinamidine cyclo-ligase [Candidatus Omnitrophota bacterium]HQO58252.1 phosphoribosylformylglycinamidine cyclo-ligase [Candidatus Omnitrophota bacterium]